MGIEIIRFPSLPCGVVNDKFAPTAFGQVVIEAMKTCAIKGLRTLVGTTTTAIETGQNTRTAILAALAMVLVEACGSSGGTTAPGSSGQATSSTPLSAPPVKIFAHPRPQEYVSVGAVTTDAGDGYASLSRDTRIRSIFFDAASQPKIRYTAAGYYEIQLPGMSYDRLIHYRGLLDPTTDNNFFQPSGVVTNGATLVISSSRLEGYNDSELASWTKADNLSGYVAFGVPAPPSALPVTGSFTYGGPVLGMVDITFEDYLYGGYYFTGATGTVTLSVDFRSYTVTGSLTVSIDGAASKTYQIAPMALDMGVHGFSGSFDADLTGYNQFTGLLTGPTAKEAIGNWAVAVLIGGQPHQFFGAWIAKQKL